MRVNRSACGPAPFSLTSLPPCLLLIFWVATSVHMDHAVGQETVGHAASSVTVLTDERTEGQRRDLHAVDAAPWRTSCATSTCHGGIEARGPAWNASVSTFLSRDPHAGAGRLLRDPDSRRIVERLDGKAANDPPTFDNVLRQRCISCHTSATADDCRDSGPVGDEILARGVHCESCHGSSQNWLAPHLEKSWSGPQRFEPSTGMRDTESVIGRASTCVRCHIGSRTEGGVVRDMNHDLIAAGHPALRFDLLLYNENLPKHWDSQSETELEFNRSAIRTRQVGRAINLAAAASLAGERAADHLNDRSSVPWPELSDYDCFACHQALSMREYELPPRGGDGQKSQLHISDGLPVWNSWHSIGNELEIRDDPQRLRNLSPHRSDPARFGPAAMNLAKSFREKASQRVESLTTDSEIRQAAMTVIESARSQFAEAPPHDWHQSAVQYLDLEAAARDLSKFPETQARGGQLMESLAVLERLLRFEPDTGGKATEHLHSPAHFDPDEFRKRLLDVLNAWGTPQANAQGPAKSRGQVQSQQDAATSNTSDHSSSVAQKS